MPASLPASHPLPPPRSSASTQEHLKRVYASFALCMFVAAAGAYINMVTHLFQVRGLWGWPLSLSPRCPPRPGAAGPGPHLPLAPSSAC